MAAGLLTPSLGRIDQWLFPRKTSNGHLQSPNTKTWTMPLTTNSARESAAQREALAARRGSRRRAGGGVMGRGRALALAAVLVVTVLLSMAILLSEAGLLERSYLLGTDCRGDAIERAKLGLYDAATLKLVRGATRDKYLRAGRATLAAGRGPPPAGPLEGRGPAGRRGGWAVGHHSVAQRGHLPQVPSRGNDLAPVGVGPVARGRADCRQGRAAAP